MLPERRRREPFGRLCVALVTEVCGPRAHIWPGLYMYRKETGRAIYAQVGVRGCRNRCAGRRGCLPLRLLIAPAGPSGDSERPRAVGGWNYASNRIQARSVQLYERVFPPPRARVGRATVTVGAAYARRVASTPRLSSPFCSFQTAFSTVASPRHRCPSLARVSTYGPACILSVYVQEGNRPGHICSSR